MQPATRARSKCISLLLPSFLILNGKCHLHSTHPLSLPLLNRQLRDDDDISSFFALYTSLFLSPTSHVNVRGIPSDEEARTYPCVGAQIDR